MFLPRNSELERLRARARQYGIEIAQADAGIAKLRSSPPEGLTLLTENVPSPAPQIARVYLRVSTDAQDLRRQDAIVGEAKAAGYYVAAVYREKASGARADRPELLRMIADLQPGEVVIAEKIDRISRLPLTEAEQLVETIRARGARLAIPGVVDLSDLAADADGIARIVPERPEERREGK